MRKIILVVILFFCMPLTVCAREDITAEDIYAESGAKELNAGEILEQYGVSFDEPSSFLSLTPAALWDIIKSIVSEKIEAPLKLLISMCIVIIITSIAGTIGDTVKKDSTTKVYELICVLAGVAAVSQPVCGILESSAKALSDGAVFMTCFVPVFAGLAAAGGNITSASGYNMLVLAVSDGCIQIADNMLMPLLSMCMGIAVVDAACGALSLKGMLEGIKKIVTWGLGLIMTVFTGLLSIQSIVGATADSLSIKTAKYVLSNCVPIVGGAVSDAYSTVRGSLALLKNGVGGIGIAVLAVMLLPPLISLALYRISVGAAVAAADIFGASKLSKLFGNIGSVLSAAMGILVCFTLMFIVSTAIAMSISTGGT